ncbi:MAG: LysM peptidoglycan-binding domain-containing protein [Candidatus Cloacimonetes bacterium]|nr:LysM peptidoglycan-binding domain-containing protein [Candidatus Cloacimonadota bacterium]
MEKINFMNKIKENTGVLLKISIIIFFFIFFSCSSNRLRDDEQLSFYRGDYLGVTDVDSLYTKLSERDNYIESLYSSIEYLIVTMDSLRNELEFNSSRIFINDGFEIPMRYTFAGVEIDLSNDRVRSMLQNIYNIEVRRAHQFIPRSGIYWDLFDSVLSQYNIHPDIKYIAVIESNLNYMAYSQAGAAGIWQFMPATARSFNLTINSYLDERRNIFKATDAACRYLIQAHNQLNALGVDDWLVTLASYNAGVGGVSRAIREQQGRDFSSLIMRVEETNQYIWRAIATKMIFEFEHLIFDEPFERMPPLLETANLVQVQVNGFHDLADWAIAKGTTTRQIWELNPWINISRTRSGRFSEINHLVIPPGDHEILIPIEAIPDPEKLEVAVRRLAVENNAPFITGNATQHRVQRGETLSTIARRYGVTANDIRRWNNIRGDMIYAGQVLNLQSGRSSGQASTSATSTVSAESSSVSESTNQSQQSGDTQRYTVKSGDTIGGIARSLGVSQNHLVSRNNLQVVVRNGREHVNIRIGQVLEY